MHYFCSSLDQTRAYFSFCEILFTPFCLAMNMIVDDIKIIMRAMSNVHLFSAVKAVTGAELLFTAKKKTTTTTSLTPLIKPRYLKKY